jgi:hypothetical protein
MKNDKLSTKSADTDVNKTVLATFRKTTCDITTQSGFPWTVTWPESPV